METIPSTPDPSDHQGPSAYEGWDPTPDPVGEVDIPDATGSGDETAAAPGIAFDPGSSSSPVPSSPSAVEEEDEVAGLRERLAFYESFDSLIRDNIDRAGALLREAATKQGDAEVKLRQSTKDFERKQIEERSGYRKVFASLLDEVSTIQQQVERLARQVSDALDDLELQLPAAGELSAIERGQAPGMTGLASVTSAPAGLPSGASSAAWVTHDVDLPAATGKHATSSPHQPDATVDAAAEERPLAADDLGVVEEAAGAIDPEVVVDVLTEGTNADPAVAGEANVGPAGAVQPTDLSDLPEEFGLENPAAAGGTGVVDEPYVEQAAVGGEAEADEIDPLDDHLTRAAESEGFYVDAASALEDLPVDDTPLRGAAPDAISEVDGGLDEAPASDDPVGSADGGGAAETPVAGESGARTPYGSDAPLETGIGSDAAGGAAANGGSIGTGERPSKQRRFESEASRSTWGSVPPARRYEPPRGSAQPVAAERGDVGAQDTIVLVHGVPRATTALSLKRYLEGLEAVTAVEPREYAEGVLRLQVTGERAIGIADLSAWPDGSGLQEVQIREDLVEIRLPG